MNLDQVQALIRTLLAAGGPIAALLIQYGMPADKVNTWISLGLAILPPIAAGIWGVLSRTDAAKVASAGAMPGVQVHVDTSPTSPAPPQVKAIALDKTDPKAHDVVPMDGPPVDKK